MIRTRNFNPYYDKMLTCQCGHPECDKRSVSQEHLDRVQGVRDEANRPLHITSGGRCPYHPNEVHRATPADHQNQVAVDIAISDGIEMSQLVKLGFKYGFNAIGVAKTFVHLGFREGRKPVMWVY